MPLDGLLAMFRQEKRAGVGMSVSQRGGLTINLGRRIRLRLAASHGRDGMRNTEESKDSENGDHGVCEHGGLTPRIESGFLISKARGGPNSCARDCADSKEVNAALFEFPVSESTRFREFSAHWKLFAVGRGYSLELFEVDRTVA
jgi:hypothetical protein